MNKRKNSYQKNNGQQPVIFSHQPIMLSLSIPILLATRG